MCVHHVLHICCTIPAGTNVSAVSPGLGERLVMTMRWSRRLKSVGTTSTVIAGSYSIAPLYDGLSGSNLTIPATGAKIYTKRAREGAQYMSNRTIDTS